MGKIIMLAHVASDDGDEFYENIRKSIAEMNGLAVDIQYAQSIQLNGKVLYSALLTGRDK